VRGHLAREYRSARLASQPLDGQARTRTKGAYRADAMHAGERAAEHGARLRLIELGRASAQEGKDREAKLPEFQQRPRIDRQGRCDRQLRGRELRREGMLLEDLLIAPALRAIELENEQLLAHAELVDAILVAVEREQPAVADESHRFRRIQHRLR